MSRNRQRCWKVYFCWSLTDRSWRLRVADEGHTHPLRTGDSGAVGTDLAHWISE